MQSFVIYFNPEIVRWSVIDQTVETLIRKTEGISIPDVIDPIKVISKR